MITLALPWVFGLAIVGALTIAALHLLSVHRPPELVLPTTRFLPDRVVQAVARTNRPSDITLLLLRMAALLAAGLAVAGPRWRSASVRRVVLAVSDGGMRRDTASIRALVTDTRDPVAAGVRVVQVFADSGVNPNDDAATLIPLAWRAATQLANQGATADSIDLHLLLSTAHADGDEGLLAWQSAWPGRITIHWPMAITRSRRVKIIQRDSANVATTGDDDVRSAFAWHAARTSLVSPRDEGSIGRATDVDTVEVFRANGAMPSALVSTTPRVRVFWPIAGAPTGWHLQVPADADGALVTAGQALLADWTVPASPDSTATAIAWWSDGRVAATERRTPQGCDREVAVVTAGASDVLLSASANRFFDRLMAPCIGREPVAASSLTMRDVQGASLAGAARFRSVNEGSVHAGAPTRVAWLTPALLAVALVLVLVEGRLRVRPYGVSA